MKKVNTIKIGNNLRKIRKSHGYTQEGFAEAIECSTRYVSDIEQNKRSPSYEVLVRICNKFEVNMNKIFEGYLENKNNSEIDLALSGYRTLEERDKKTIRTMIEYFNEKED